MSITRLSSRGWLGLVIPTLVWAVLAGLATPAFAASAHVRIEGAQRTVWAGSVSLGSATVTDSSGVAHVSAGNALSALEMSARAGAFAYVVDDLPFGLFVNSIAGEMPVMSPPYPGWTYRVNGASPSVGADQFVLKDGDEVLWSYGEWDWAPSAVVVPAGTVPVGATATLIAQQLDTMGKPASLSGATVQVGSKTLVSGSDGSVGVALSSPGDYGVRVEKDGYIRSAIKTLKVRYTSKLGTPKVSSASVKKGRKVIVKGVLSGVGAKPAGRKVTLYARTKGAKTWTAIASKKATSNGAYAFSVKVTKSRYYRVRFAGDSSFAAATSPSSRLVKAR